mmetsp:Transcript_2102/g.4783  ORF Transcript_2102/g.4783 Transcript_2102/m.4783 type:complete len:659 (-) Transcript_2102:143-2119(-)
MERAKALCGAVVALIRGDTFKATKLTMKAADGTDATITFTKPQDNEDGSSPPFGPYLLMRIVACGFIWLAFLGALALIWAAPKGELAVAFGAALLMLLGIFAALAAYAAEGLNNEVSEVHNQNNEYAAALPNLEAQVDQLGEVEKQLNNVQGQLKGGLLALNRIMDTIDRDANVAVLTTILDAFTEEDHDFGNKNMMLQGEELKSFFQSCKRTFEKEFPDDEFEAFQKLCIEKDYPLSLRAILTPVALLCSAGGGGRRKAQACILLYLFALEPESEERLNAAVDFVGPALSSWGGKEKMRLALKSKATSGVNGTVPCEDLADIVTEVVHVPVWPAAAGSLTGNRQVATNAVQVPRVLQAKRGIALPAHKTRGIHLGLNKKASRDLEAPLLGSSEHYTPEALKERCQTWYKGVKQEYNDGDHLALMYEVPMVIIPALIWCTEIWLFFWTFSGFRNCLGRIFWTWFVLMPGLIPTGMFLRFNADLFITYLRAQVQLARFRQNNLALKQSIAKLQVKVQNLRVAEQAFEQLNARFGGNIEMAEAELKKLNANAKSNIQRNAKRLASLYCDSDKDGVDAGEELDRVLSMLSGVFGAMFQDFPDRIQQLKLGLSRSARWKKDQLMDMETFSSLVGEIMQTEDVKKICDIVKVKLDGAPEAPAA